MDQKNRAAATGCGDVGKKVIEAIGAEVFTGTFRCGERAVGCR